MQGIARTNEPNFNFFLQGKHHDVISVRESIQFLNSAGPVCVIIFHVRNISLERNMELVSFEANA